MPATDAVRKLRRPGDTCILPAPIAAVALGPGLPCSMHDDNAARQAASLFSDASAWLTPTPDAPLHRVRELTWMAVPAFDTALRTNYRAREAAPPLSPSRLRAMSLWNLDLLLAASCHPDGRVREDAVALLARSEEQQSLPFLLVRLNDWVGAVRSRAREAIRGWLTRSHASLWVKALPLLDRLGKQSRDDHRWLLERVQTLVLDEPGLVAWSNGMKSQERGIQKLLITIAEARPDAAMREPLLASAAHGDPAVARRAARLFLALTPGDDPALRPLLASRHRAVRLQAYEAALARCPAESDALLEAACFDDASLVREWARWELSKRGQDARARYLAESSSGPRRFRALQGLAELGKAEDDPLFLPLLTSKVVDERELAVTVLGRRPDRSTLPRLVARLQDASPRVARAAARALASEVLVLEHDDLLAAIERGCDVGATQALLLAFRGPLPVAILASLRARDLGRPVSAQLASQALDHLGLPLVKGTWGEPVPPPAPRAWDPKPRSPSEPQQQALSHELSRRGDSLPVRLRATLESLLALS